MEDELFEINELIIRYLDESATEEEKQFLFDWIKQSKANEKLFLETRDLWLSCISDAGKNNNEAIKAFNKLKCRIQSTEDKMYTNRVRRILYPVLQITAAVLVLIGLGYVLFENSFFQKDDVEMKEFVSVEKQKEAFLLSDGSRVWLNANSKLIYPERFHPDKREVQLEGGGFFEIVHNKQASFIIATGDLKVEVLGTRLDISNYSDDKDIETVLVEGSIQITGQTLKKPVMLKPNEKFTYSKSTQQVSVKEVNAADYTSWKNKALVFDNEPLSDIIIQLERWYSVNIQCSDSFARQTRMSFRVKDESIDEVLNIMGVAASLKYMQEGDTIRISGK